MGAVIGLDDLLVNIRMAHGERSAALWLPDDCRFEVVIIDETADAPSVHDPNDLEVA